LCADLSFCIFTITNNFRLNNWFFVLLLCASLGLAPFKPEPHIVADLRWVLGGAVGMKAINWFDLLLHGFPWLMLIRLIFVNFAKLFKS